MIGFLWFLIQLFIGIIIIKAIVGALMSSHDAQVTHKSTATSKNTNAMTAPPKVQIVTRPPPAPAPVQVAAETTEKDPDVRFCPYCGAKLQELGARFCSSCGTQVH